MREQCVKHVASRPDTPSLISRLRSTIRYSSPKIRSRVPCPSMLLPLLVHSSFSLFRFMRVRSCVIRMVRIAGSATSGCAKPHRHRQPAWPTNPIRYTHRMIFNTACCNAITPDSSRPHLHGRSCQLARSPSPSLLSIAQRPVQPPFPTVNACDQPGRQAPLRLAKASHPHRQIPYPSSPLWIAPTSSPCRASQWP